MTEGTFKALKVLVGPSSTDGGIGRVVSDGNRAQVAGALFERSELEQRLEAIESTPGPRMMAADLRRRQT